MHCISIVYAFICIEIIENKLLSYSNSRNPMIRFSNKNSGENKNCGASLDLP